MEEIQKILLAIMPAYFYFVPYFLFPYLYKKFVKNIFYKIQNKSADAYDEIHSLENRVSRIIEFIAFLSIAVVTFIAVLFDKEHKNFFFFNCNCFSLTIAFIGLSILNVFNNLNGKEKFILSKLDKSVEIFTVLFSIPLIYFYA